MIRLLAILLLLSCTAAAAPARGTFDEQVFLDEQRAVENFEGRDGAAGERGPYQIMEATWRQHMPGVPFSEARKEGPGRACALKHIRWLREQLAAASCSDGVFMTSLAYNAGLDRTLSGRAPVKSYQRAGRVENLYKARR